MRSLRANDAVDTDEPEDLDDFWDSADGILEAEGRCVAGCKAAGFVACAVRIAGVDRVVNFADAVDKSFEGTAAGCKGFLNDRVAGL